MPPGPIILVDKPCECGDMMQWKRPGLFNRRWRPCAEKRIISMTDDLKRRIMDADERASRWLADGNEALETGDTSKAEKCYEKSQFWRDRFNKLSGNS